jgi:hypothetical protein
MRTRFDFLLLSPVVVGILGQVAEVTLEEFILALQSIIIYLRLFDFFR